MGKHRKWVKNKVQNEIHRFPLLKEYQDSIENYIIFHLVALGVRYKENGQASLSEYIRKEPRIADPEYLKVRRLFYSLNDKTKKMQEERKNLTPNSEKWEVQIHNFWHELLLFIGNEIEGEQLEKQTRLKKIIGQISRKNYKAIKYNDFTFYDEFLREKIENEFETHKDELEVGLHLYMAQKAVNFHFTKHFCKVLDEYNKEAKTPKIEHARTLDILLKIPSLRIMKEYLEMDSFNPNDYEEAFHFLCQFMMLTRVIMDASYDYLRLMYDTQRDYYVDKMEEKGYYVNSPELKNNYNRKNLKQQSEIADFFSFVRAIVKEDDEDAFFHEVTEFNYLNDFTPKGNEPDFTVNTFNKLKLLRTQNLEEVQSFDGKEGILKEEKLNYINSTPNLNESIAELQLINELGILGVEIPRYHK
ncbi:hypothetical protein CSV69_10205 [Sporosarcina sp. P26b]|uniref:hypothetical protein n=1 Tax=Sporosarcina sp. P26b TaxID=2048253 RepID=UPI000C1638AB|nr:hypothetical protein [Sporosarcina sp. P26b]PIC95703.1 hypothetical protein CSV69_10205 [Sporosarcina sp. P26b]